MSENTETILAERGGRYGPWEEQVLFISRMRQLVEDEAMANTRFLELSDKQQAIILESFHMIVCKMARCLQGDPLYMDNFEDIIGYARLVHDGILSTLETEE